MVSGSPYFDANDSTSVRKICSHINLVVSHIQRIGCQPEKILYLPGGQSRCSKSADQGK